MDRPPSRSALLVLVGLLFAAVAVAASVTDPEVARVPTPRLEIGDGRGAERAERPEPDDPAGDRPEPEPAADGLVSPDLGWLAGLGLLLLLVLGLALMWRTVRGRVTLRAAPAAGPTDQAQRRERVREVVAAGLDELAADDADPRGAVIGCWLRLENAVVAAGTRREAADAPADLVARMLAEHEVSGAVLERFAAVYREARYAPHDIGEPVRVEARAALERLHAELSSGRVSEGREVPG